MLSVPANRQAGRCIYCAFRSQQLAHQARRLKSSSTKQTKGPVISYYKAGTAEKARADGLFDGLGRASQSKNPGQKQVLRNLEQWGLDEQTHRKRGGGNAGFEEELKKQLAELKDELEDAPLLEQLKKEKQAEGEKAETFSQIWQSFARKVAATPSVDEPWGSAKSLDNKSTMHKDLQQAFRNGGSAGLRQRIKYAFYAHITKSRFTQADIRNQIMLADLRYPTEWYPATRSMHRKIHLHVGPTNSGKTYHALQRLEKAERGVYAGPLRLLAHEVYTRLNAKGKACALITGEERRAAGSDGPPKVGDLDMSSCTVEMMPLNKTLDVAVIDEIQMIGNPERGWAWTQALLGVKAKEVHLCGEARTVPIISELCASVGEELIIHHYERLSPLKMAEESLDGDLRRLQKGDCIVSFSVMGIHALRKEIERRTGRKVAIVYGSLPPETRAQQARLFNDPNNDYDYLVASDAVGMGLNLAIKRMIFEASSKFDGVQRRTLSVADTKQIAGRAGRYRTAEQASQEPTAEQDLAAAKGDSPAEVVERSKKENVGIVTTLEKFDLPIVTAAMAAEPEPIRTAGLYPPGSVLERFASYFPPGTPFSYVLTRLHELSQMHSRFHLCGLKEQLWVADCIEPVRGLTVADRNIICAAPVSRREDMYKTLLPAYARCIADQTGGNIVDIEELPLEVLEAEVSPSREYLRDLERLHKGIVTYLWLSYRFAGIFTTRALAFHIKSMVEEKIEFVLSKFSFSEAARKKAAAARQKQLLLDLSESARAEEAAVEEAQRQAAELESDGSAALSKEGETRSEVEVDVDVREDPPGVADLDDQSTLGAGGDHFAGDLDMPLEDPAEAEVDIVEDEVLGMSINAEEPVESADSKDGSPAEQNFHDDPSISEASAGAEEAGVATARSNDQAFIASPASEEPKDSDASHELLAEVETSVNDDGTPATAPVAIDNASGDRAPAHHLHIPIDQDPAPEVERGYASRP